MLVALRQNEQLRLDIVKKLLAGKGEEHEPPTYAKFSKRDLERANLVVRTFAPHLAAEIEVLIRVKYPGPRNRAGHPRDPLTERAALAFELLKRCRARRPAQIIHAILRDMGKHITEESIERDYRRRNRTRLVRVHHGFTEIPAGDLHRVLLWRLHSLSSTPPRP